MSDEVGKREERVGACVSELGRWDSTASGCDLGHQLQTIASEFDFNSLYGEHCTASVYASCSPHYWMYSCYADNATDYLFQTPDRGFIVGVSTSKGGPRSFHWGHDRRVEGH